MLDSEFDSYPRETVTYLGVPYSDARLINGVWYFRTIEGNIGTFCFQEQVSTWKLEPHRQTVSV